MRTDRQTRCIPRIIAPASNSSLANSVANFVVRCHAGILPGTP